MQRRDQSGFTLIELMVTLAVFAILAALSAPSFARMIEKSRLRGAADDVVNLIGIARSEAVKRQRNVDVAFNTSTWCVGANRASDPASLGAPTPNASACDCTTASSCVLEGQQSVVTPPAGSGVTAALTGSATDFIFSGQLGTVLPIDTAPPGPLTLTSSSGDFALQISISPLGQVTTCIPSGKLLISGFPSC